MAGVGAMDLEKIINWGGSYLRDYVLTLLSVLSGRFTPPGGSGTAEHELTATDNRTWLFALMSLVLGQIAFLPITRGEAGAELQYYQLVFTFWMWLLVAGASHLLLLLSREPPAFLVTLAACLRVMPTVYLVSCLSALTLFVLMSGAAQEWNGATAATLLFLFVQFVLLAVYLPHALTRGQPRSPARQAALAFVLPGLVFVANVLGLGILAGGVLKPPVANVQPSLSPPRGPPPATLPPNPDRITDLFHTRFETSRGSVIIRRNGYWAEGGPLGRDGAYAVVRYREIGRSETYVLLLSQDDRQATLQLPLYGGEAIEKLKDRSGSPASFAVHRVDWRPHRPPPSRPAR